MSSTHPAFGLLAHVTNFPKWYSIPDLSRRIAEALEEVRYPEPLKSVAHPAFIPPLVDINTTSGMWNWYRLVDSEFTLGALDLQSCPHQRLGGPPDWWMDEDAESLAIDLGVKQSGSDDGSSVNWALNHGVAPGQVFLVHIPPPRVTTTYDGETDAEFSPQVVRTLPKRNALNTWDEFFRRTKAKLRALDRKQESIAAAQFRDKTKWELVCNKEGGCPFQMHVQSKLYATTHPQMLVAQGKESVTKEGAFESLLADFHDRYPGEDDTPLWRLGVNHDIRRSVWDRINIDLEENG